MNQIFFIFINFSRIKQDNASHDSDQGLPMMPGITLKFCVSDVGLAALLKCQSLYRITMNKRTDQCLQPSNRGITLDGVRRLVKGTLLLLDVSVLPT